ncbi:MAG: PKD domain-containing protein, partial [Saprospiraceae bacterium]|nr:PKD domain-containing protein [Saprospiraceae bacterium]
VVTLSATNSCGTVTATETLLISTLPVGGFTADITDGCAPMTVQFQDLSSGNTSGWSWSFPGGNPNASTAQNPVVEYVNPGTFGVTLIVTNANGADTLTQMGYISVGQFPTADFTSSANGLEVSFTNLSAHADSYLWTFGDGNTSMESDPTHTYAQDGEYTVILTATNACGSELFTQTVVVAT